MKTIFINSIFAILNFNILIIIIKFQRWKSYFLQQYYEIKPR